MTGKITDGAVGRIHGSGLSVLWGDKVGKSGLSSRGVVGFGLLCEQKQTLEFANKSNFG